MRSLLMPPRTPHGMLARWAGCRRLPATWHPRPAAGEATISSLVARRARGGAALSRPPCRFLIPCSNSTTGHCGCEGARWGGGGGGGGGGGRDRTTSSRLRRRPPRAGRRVWPIRSFLPLHSEVLSEEVIPGREKQPSTQGWRQQPSLRRRPLKLIVEAEERFDPRSRGASS